MNTFEQFKQTVMEEFAGRLNEEKQTKLVVKKISPKWYRIVIDTDKWDIPETVVDILQTEHKEWSVCYGEKMSYSVGEQSHDTRRWVFVKLNNAKVYALDLAAAIKNDKPYPSILDDKYEL
jgi:hypothetical protein